LHITEGVQHNYSWALTTISRSKTKINEDIMNRERMLYQTTKSNCNCDQYRKFSALFGIKVPCRHQLALDVLPEDPSSLFKYEFTIPKITTSVTYNISSTIKFNTKFKISTVVVIPDYELRLDIFPPKFKNIHPKNILFESICNAVMLNSRKIDLNDFYIITWDGYYNGPYQPLIENIPTDPILSAAITNYLIFKIQSFIANRKSQPASNSEPLEDSSEVPQEYLKIQFSDIRLPLTNKIQHKSLNTVSDEEAMAIFEQDFGPDSDMAEVGVKRAKKGRKN
jgi:hypothetical protein